MAIIGLGIDLVAVARIKSSLDSYGERFKKRIFSQKEIEYCDTRPHPALHYAARFAAKEAFVKAIGTGFRYGIKHSEIEIQHDPLGKPVLLLYGTALQQVEKVGATIYHVSLSHTDEQGTAVIILEK